LPEEHAHGTIVFGKSLNGTGAGGVSWEVAAVSHPKILTASCAGWVLLSDECTAGILLALPAET